MKVEISKLTPHPLNHRIYGYDDDLNELTDKIKSSGWVKPILITKNNMIISGHRRVEVCKILGITEIECEIVDDDPIKQLELFVGENFYRVKTTYQLMKESEIYFDIEKKKSYQRQVEIGKKNLVQSPDKSKWSYLGQTGRTTQIVSDKIGMGETTYKKGRKVMEFVEDHPEHEWIVETTMNKSVNKSYELTQKPPEFIEEVIVRVGRNKNMVIPIIRELEKEKLNSQTPLPPGKFSVIYTDLTQKSIDPLRQTNLSEICETDCILFIWVKPEQLVDGLKITEYWKFKYQTCMVWNKDVLNEVSEDGEILLISTKGIPQKTFKQTIGNLEKPELVRNLIQDGNKTLVVELFVGEGWEIW